MSTQFLANYIVNDLLGLLHRKHRTIQNCGIAPEQIAAVCELIEGREIVKMQAKQYLEAIIDGKG